MMNSIKPLILEKRNAAPLAAGILLGLAGPAIGWWPLAWLGLVPALWALLNTRHLGVAFAQGLAMGLVYYGFVFGWFWGLHPLAWMGLPDPVSQAITLAGWLLCIITQGLIIGLIWLALAWLHNRCGLLGLALAPCVWVILLWGLNQNPIGLPFGFLAYSQAAFGPVRQSAYTLTFWGLEACIVAVNLILALAWQHRARWLAGVAVATMIAIGLLGHFSPPPPSSVLGYLNPVVVQPFLPIETERRFLSPAQKQRYYQMLVSRAMRQPNVGNSRLLVLPEGALAVRQLSWGKPFSMPWRIALLSGAVFPYGQGEANGAVVYTGSQKAQAFGKHYLVPFGETTPFIPGEWIAGSLQLLGIDYSLGFTPAPLNQPLLKVQNNQVGPFICFEALYPTLAQHYRAQGATLLVTFSNLGWYHLQPGLEKQFLAINQLRAAETGLPVILATNTGVSAIIAPTGAIVSKTHSGQCQFLTPQGATSCIPKHGSFR